MTAQCRPLPDEAARQTRGEQVTGKAMDEAEEEAIRARAAAKLFEGGAGPSLPGRPPRRKQSRRSDLRDFLDQGVLGNRADRPLFYRRQARKMTG